MSDQATVSFPLPPPDALMPGALQTVFLWLTIIAAAAIMAWSVVMALRQRSAVPVLLVSGGFVAIIMETVVTFLGHAVHPEQGQLMMFDMVNRAIPWHIALGYMAGFGSLYLLIYRRFVERSLSAGFIWKSAVITALAYFFGEAYPVSQGLWIYYGPQPLRIWDSTAPLTWNWLNTCCMITSLTLMLFALQYLKGIALLLLPVLAAVGAYMGHMGAGFPMYNAMNSTLPGWAIELSGAASVALALVLIWLSSKLLLDLQDRRR